jgi:hypothetical protein
MVSAERIRNSGYTLTTLLPRVSRSRYMHRYGVRSNSQQLATTLNDNDRLRPTTLCEQQSHTLRPPLRSLTTACGGGRIFEHVKNSTTIADNYKSIIIICDLLWTVLSHLAIISETSRTLVYSVMIAGRKSHSGRPVLMVVARSRSISSLLSIRVVASWWEFRRTP